MKCLLVTFGDGNLGYRRAAKRVANQTQRFESITEARSYAAPDLIDIKNRFGLPADVFSGWALGHFAWKPWVVLHALREGDWDFVIYSDAGNWVNVTPSTQVLLTGMVETGFANGGFAFSAGPHILESDYTAPSVLQKLNVSRADSLSPQLQAGLFGIGKDSFSFLNQWAALVSEEELLTPTGFENNSSRGKQLHRYDQSLFSVLWKQWALPWCGESTNHHPGNSHFDDHLAQKMPFWTSRHRSGMLSLSMNPVLRAARAIEMLVP